VADGRVRRTTSPQCCRGSRQVLRLEQEIAAVKAERFETSSYEALLDQYEAPEGRSRRSTACSARSRIFCPICSKRS